MSLETVEMDTSGTPAAPPIAPPTGRDGGVTGTGTVVTTDFLLKALKENTDHLQKSFNASLGAVSQRIDNNSTRITANANSISQQASTTGEHQAMLKKLADRVSTLERGVNVAGRHGVPKRRAALSPDYLLARRSVRLWPIAGCDDKLWEGVGEFLHETLAIR